MTRLSEKKLSARPFSELIRLATPDADPALLRAVRTALHRKTERDLGAAAAVLPQISDSHKYSATQRALASEVMSNFNITGANTSSSSDPIQRTVRKTGTSASSLESAMPALQRTDLVLYGRTLTVRSAEALTIVALVVYSDTRTPMGIARKLSSTAGILSPRVTAPVKEAMEFLHANGYLDKDERQSVYGVNQKGIKLFSALVNSGDLAKLLEDQRLRYSEALGRTPEWSTLFAITVAH